MRQRLKPVSSPPPEHRRPTASVVRSLLKKRVTTKPTPITCKAEPVQIFRFFGPPASPPESGGRGKKEQTWNVGTRQRCLFWGFSRRYYRRWGC